jgi:hypothetical protein
VNLRTDSWHDACRLRAVRLGAVPDPTKLPAAERDRYDPEWLVYVATREPARPGDVWQLRQNPSGPYVQRSYGGNRPGWPVCGYVLVCPVATCPEGGHDWDHAFDCPAGARFGAACKRGAARASCWDWSGNAGDGTLTANPSLQVLPCPDAAGVPTTCQFHGWLRAGHLA